MNTCQPGILALPPRHSRYLSFSLLPGCAPQKDLKSLAALADGERVVVGLGTSLILALEGHIDGLQDFPAHTAPGIDIPSTPSALWCWLRSDDPGELLHLSRQIEAALVSSFAMEQLIEAFQYRDSRDLTGYEDGTENPEGDEAINAALVQGQGEGMDGSSFVAVQQWWHDLDEFQALTQTEQDHIIGRRLSDNEEIEEAPESAHVKRTAQEDFEPEAFVLRRSMPWTDGMNAGLVFTAFGKSLDAYEMLLRRMLGKDDGIIDGLFQFSRPLTGAYYWCPPVHGGGLDLSRLGL